MPVPSPATILPLLTSLVTKAGPLVVGPVRPTCNYPFPIPTGVLRNAEIGVESRGATAMGSTVRL
jgi:hypothetical protein